MAARQDEFPTSHEQNFISETRFENAYETSYEASPKVVETGFRLVAGLTFAMRLLIRLLMSLVVSGLMILVTCLVWILSRRV